MKTSKRLTIITSQNPDDYLIKETVTKIIYGEVTNEINSVTRNKNSLMNPADTRKYSVVETAKRIINLTDELTNFWKSAENWAPIEAAGLLTKSRLDWQASLTRQLNLFLDKSNNESGYLILAWTTLGSLTEGVLKHFFISIL